MQHLKRMDALDYANLCGVTSGDDDDEDAAGGAGDDSCMICLECMAGGGAHRLPCGHRFHAACIAASYQLQRDAVRECVYCRATYAAIPYRSGTFVKGLHARASLDELLARGIPPAEVQWDELDASSRLFLHRGKNGMQIGGFVRHTRNRLGVFVRLADGAVVQSVRRNVSLLREETDGD